MQGRKRCAHMVLARRPSRCSSNGAAHEGCGTDDREDRRGPSRRPRQPRRWPQPPQTRRARRRGRIPRRWVHTAACTWGQEHRGVVRHRGGGSTVKRVKCAYRSAVSCAASSAPEYSTAGCALRNCKDASNRITSWLNTMPWSSARASSSWTRCSSESEASSGDAAGRGGTLSSITTRCCRPGQAF